MNCFCGIPSVLLFVPLLLVSQKLALTHVGALAKDSNPPRSAESRAFTGLAPVSALPTATPAGSPSRTVFITTRGDGSAGSGTKLDPYDGSSASRFDTL